MKRIALFLKTLVNDRSGSVLMLTGLMLLIIIAAGGAGLDFGRQQLIRTKLQQASDAGALAAASLASLSPSYGTQDRSNIALRYYSLNYPNNFLGKKRPIPQIDGDRISVTALDDNIETHFISAVNVDRIEAQGHSVVQRAQSVLANYDVALVMDNSGSMGYADVGAGASYREPPNRSATIAAGTNAYRTTYINFVVRDLCPQYVPSYYATLEACYSGYAAAFEASDLANPDQFFGLQGATRLNALRFAANNFLEQLFGTTGSNNRTSIITWSIDTPLTTVPLTSDRTLLSNAIDGMFGINVTNSTPGLLEAEKQMDTSIAGDPENKRIRAVVLMTDGINTISVAPPTYSTIPGNPKLQVVDVNGCRGDPDLGICAKTNEMSLDVCTSLKKKQVQVYTVAFGPEVLANNVKGQQARAFLQACASPDTPQQKHFFPASTAAELDDIFKAIVTQIQSLRITD